jgi:hypothetical protein
MNNDREENPLDMGLYSQLRDTMHNIDISFSNILGIVFELARAAEKMRDIPGIEKKFVVINAIRNYIMYDTIRNEEQQALLSFVDHTLPNLIDLMITLDKSQLMIKMKKKCLFCIPM